MVYNQVKSFSIGFPGRFSYAIHKKLRIFSQKSVMPAHATQEKDMGLKEQLAKKTRAGCKILERDWLSEARFEH